MKRHILYILLALPLLLTACATGSQSDPLAPEWFKALEEQEGENCFLVKIAVSSAGEEETLEKAVDELFSRVMELSGLSELYAAREDQDSLKEQLRILIQTEKDMEGIVSLSRQEWVPDEQSSNYYGAFCIYKTAEVLLSEQLIETYYSNDETLNAYLAKADEYERTGQYYGAAEELVKAALYALEKSGPMSLEVAQLYIDRAAALLRQIAVTQIQAPQAALVNTMISDPFLFRCSVEEADVPGVEFLVRYEGRTRDGSRGQFERRLVSNESGTVEFFHPFIPFAGSAPVAFTPGSREFHSILSSLENRGADVSQLRNWIETASLQYSILTDSGSRELPMGVVLLHTDITGTALDNNESSTGLAEALSQNDFSVDVLSLDPGEISRITEPAFLRDLKAYYGERYVRIIFGTVEIMDFESRGDSYRVKTGGTLKVADVNSGEILLELKLDKSVESRNNALAVTASFRELGKAFAQELINTLE